MDEGQPETQSSGFLDDRGDEYARTKCITFCHYTLRTDTAQVGQTIYTLSYKASVREDLPRELD
jgi:hypothetical protein